MHKYLLSKVKNNLNKMLTLSLYKCSIISICFCSHIAYSWVKQSINKRKTYCIIIVITFNKLILYIKFKTYKLFEKFNKEKQYMFNIFKYSYLIKYKRNKKLLIWLNKWCNFFIRSISWPNYICQFWKSKSNNNRW